MNKPIILTGIRSNDTPTLGNYIGAMLPMVELQRAHAGEYQLNMFVPDLHSFTTPVDHDILYQNCLQNIKYFVAAGLNSNNPDTFVYRQSFVPAHCELTTILDNFAYFGELSRMTQFKENSDQAKSGTVTAGLFNYPVMMAADILLYGAKFVPVGDDQRQHLEFARDIGARFNNKFGEIFALPEPWEKQLAFSHRDSGVRIRSLQNPSKKMSKSVADPKGTILLTDAPNEAAAKIKAAVTDDLADIQFDMVERPGVSNLLQVLALLSGEPREHTVAAWRGKASYGELKNAVAAKVESFLGAFQATASSVTDEQLEAKLSANELAMNKVAGATLLRVQQAVGLRPKS